MDFIEIFGFVQIEQLKINCVYKIKEKPEREETELDRDKIQ